MSTNKKDRDNPPQDGPVEEVPASADALGDAPPHAEAAPTDPLEAVRRERDDLLGRLQRVSADYVNYQKRVQKDIDSARTFANEGLMKALLGVVDDMERALAAGRQNHEADDPFVQGMQLVHDKTLETLGKFGLGVIEAEGKPFDPDLHQAMMQQPSADHPPQTVLTEVAKGYRLHGRTLRPSGVIISKPPDDADGPQSGREDAADDES